MCPQPITTATLGTSALKTVITHYYRDLKEYEGKADYELALRSAFQNLLADTARMVNWILIPEQTLDGGIRPDGVMRDTFNLRRGYWEAKGPKSDLEKEIIKKIANNYPLVNTIFENTKRAVLYQNRKRQYEFDLHNSTDVSDLLRQFFTYTEPDIANFEAAVQEFKQRIPELAQGLLETIEQEHKLNRKFIGAFDTFASLCRTSLDPKISKEAVNEMLVQHLLTKRLFRTIFGNSEFTNRNIIASEIEKVIQALTSRVFNAGDFLKNLDRFYVAIEAAARGLENWSERQHFLNTVYERFFQGFSVKQADTHGIVYTPQEIVDFMCASVDEVLQREFGTSISEPDIQILDPATGTGNFIVNLMRRIPRSKLKYKYQNDLFCNEIMLLPYYIASLNIEHEYYERMKEYEPFNGVCFADTLELAEGQQLSLFVEENTERVQREKDAQIMVVIGNPPYNVGQKSENDNNKNRRYPVIEKRVRETYVKGSKATNTRAVSDAYIKFFRWAIDRLGQRDGIVCFISNNGFIDGIAFDMLRKRLVEDFTYIYHIDLGGNVRKQSKSNVFGIMVGVGITILVRHHRDALAQGQRSAISYYRLSDNLNPQAKLQFLSEKGDIAHIEWQNIKPNEGYVWLVDNLHKEFDTSLFLSMGNKESKLMRIVEVGGVKTKTIFKTYSRGAETTRDSWMYDFDFNKLADKVGRMIETYNSEVSRWVRAGCPKDIDSFVIADETKIKWSSRLKECLMRRIEVTFTSSSIRNSLYRPFTRQYLYFDNVMTHRQGMFPIIFPTSATEAENIVIWLKVGSDWPMFALAANVIPDLLPQGGSQCFPYYTYTEDGSNRRENITDWALQQFHDKYGSEVTKWNIFHYVYGMLHHPQYRERYAENLKHDLPHIPLLLRQEAFETCTRIGKQLMDLHLNYEQTKEYPLKWIENEDIPFSWHVKKMRLTSDRTAVIVNESLTLSGIPQECFQYRLGNRSALEWVIDQYQVSKDKRSGIESDPNLLDDEEYIVHLVGKVVMVSVETVKLVNELAQAVTVEDWLGKTVDMIE